MFHLLIFCIASVAATEVEFEVVTARAIVEIPGVHAIAADIERSVPDWGFSSQNITSGSNVSVSAIYQTRQFHGIAQDSQGSYYTTSIHTHMCEIREVGAEDFFYEDIPRNFTEGTVAFIPCLADGVPSPIKQLQRCDNETCESYTIVKDGLASHNGHVIFQHAVQDQTGWYRCSASNVCGAVETTPIFINVRKGEPPLDRPGIIVSRRTEEFTISYRKDPSLDNYEVELKRVMTPYEIWRMNTTKPSYSDEVVFMEEIDGDTERIYRFYYPYHSDYGSSEELSLSGEMDDHLHYGAVSHNNSYVTHFSKLTFVADFDTELITPPDIVAPGDEIFMSPSKITLVFNIRSVIHKRFNQERQNFVCFKDTVKLEDSWKTQIAPLSDTQSAITITILSPIAHDSGYYQCGVMYDVLYLSSETFVHIDDPQDFFNPSTLNITSRGAVLSWDPPSNYHGDFIVHLSHEMDSTPIRTSTNSLPLKLLLPYNQYSWFVITLSQQPVTDTRTFLTGRDVPEANVGLLSVLPSENAVQVSWPDFPASLWHDDRVYFTISTYKISNVSESEAMSVTEPRSVTPEDYINQTSHIHSSSVQGLEAATSYTVMVTACNSVGCSGNSSRLNVTTKYSVLDTSPQVLVMEISQEYVEVTAVYNESNEVYLEMFSGELCFSAPNIPSTPLIHLKTDSTNRLDQLNSFSVYTIRARATNGYSTSPWSECVKFRTSFMWWLAVIPVLVVVVLLILVAVVRAVIRSRCPDVISKVKQALEPRYVNIHQPIDDWETSNEVAIIHTAFEDCDL